MLAPLLGTPGIASAGMNSPDIGTPRPCHKILKFTLLPYRDMAAGRTPAQALSSACLP